MEGVVGPARPVTARQTACSLGHRIRKTITIDGLELIVYQCCDSRECLFKRVEGGVMFCTYGDLADDGRDRGGSVKDQRKKEKR